MLSLSLSLSICVFLMLHLIRSRSLSTMNLLASRDTGTEPKLLEAVRTLCARDQLHEALSLFCASNGADTQTCAALLHECARHGRLAEGRALHHRALNLNLQRDLFVANHLINMYSKCGCLDSARKVFDEMPHRNIVSWTALISGYDQNGLAEDCFRLFSSMLAHHRPTEFAFASVISSCNRERGRQVHGLALKTCFDACVYAGNALISMYSKSSHNDALSVFESMPTRNLITWNSMIAGFLLRGLVGRCLEFFSYMHREDIGFDRSTLLSVIASLSRSNNSTLEQYYCYQLHCLTVKIGLVLEIEVATALVKAYSELGGDINECYKLFSETSRHDIVSWTALMTTFAERAQEEALLLFRQLRLQGMDPDCYTFSIAIKASAGLPTESTALVLHGLIIKYGFDGETVLGNALVHAYARCGSIELSMHVFDCMRVRDTVSWNSMFKAYSVHGRGREALNLFARMNARPDSATFVALLSACSHAGLVDEGIEIFDSMLVKYGMVPQCDHYACMIDILGRAGRLSKAEVLISQMPMEPDSVVWSALLGAWFELD